jgi:hypothetical protein
MAVAMEAAAAMAVAMEAVAAMAVAMEAAAAMAEGWVVGSVAVAELAVAEGWVGELELRRMQSPLLIPNDR